MTGTTQSGSRWRRWDPHIHAPGTILNDQYGGDWERFLGALESKLPIIEAIGITDYYNLNAYESVLAAKDGGRLQNCGLIFPNIEMRLALGTVKGGWVNVHLLVSPEADDHVTEAKRFLSRLTFEAFGDTFSCTPEDLVRLGRKAGATGDALAALRLGTTQFKVSLDQLRSHYRSNEWANANVLIAVAGGKDGLHPVLNTPS
jgi:hypothetical protein